MSLKYYYFIVIVFLLVNNYDLKALELHSIQNVFCIFFIDYIDSNFFCICISVY
jgi:hypothetical protein